MPTRWQLAGFRIYFCFVSKIFGVELEKKFMGLVILRCNSGKIRVCQENEGGKFRI